jgi:hypothetical protein
MGRSRMSYRKMEEAHKMKTHTNIRKNNCFSIMTENIFDISVSRINTSSNGATVIIPHVCNNANVFGAGFAAAVAEKFPIVKENFNLLGNKAKLGQIQNIDVLCNKLYGNRLVVSNMIAQNGLFSPKNNRPLNYGALCFCMTEVRNLVKSLSKSDTNKVEIHAPKFGSGLAGGDWKFISELINDIWNGIDVYVYTLNKSQK